MSAPTRSTPPPTSSTALRGSGWSGRHGRERHRPADRFGQRAPGDQRCRAAGRIRIRRLPDVDGHPPAPVRLTPERYWAQKPSRLLDWNGMPLSCHLMLTRRPAGSLRTLSRADRAHRAWRPVSRQLAGVCGVPSIAERDSWPRRCCRPPAAGDQDYVDRGVPRLIFERSPSGTARCEISRPGPALHEIVDRRLGDPFFGIFLNRVTLAHLDPNGSIRRRRGSS